MKLSGKPIAARIYKELAKKVDKLKKNGITPTLAVLLIGNNPASVAYVNQKEKNASEIGAKVIIFHYKSDVSQQELIQRIQELGEDNDVNGILIQQPLPNHL